MQSVFVRSSVASISKKYARHCFSSKLFNQNIPNNNYLSRNFSIVTTRNINGLNFNNTLLRRAYEHNSSCRGTKLNVSSNFVRCLSQKTEINNLNVENATNNVIDLSANSNLSQSSIEAVVNSINQTGADLPLSALNIGSIYTPIGWCVNYLDFLHSVFPWWGSIMVGTIILRVCLFPLVISAQRSAAKLNEIMPEQAMLKEKMNQARLVGDNIEFARLSNESLTLFKRRGVNPIKAMLAPMAQAPVFLTFFLTLRRMANYPVESLQTGGILWFNDLTIPDPLYVLPIITSLTLWLTLEASFRTGFNPNQTPIFKFGARVIPVLTLIFTYDFPAAIMTYWLTNNAISIVQVLSLKQPAVRDFLNIPQIKVNPMHLDVNKKSFKKHFKEAFENAKINKLMEERNTIDEITFKKSGIGPLQKTFKQDPTRIKNN